MSYKEADFQTDFNKWLARHLDLFSTTSNFELKVTKTNRFDYCHLRPHQVPWLLNQKHRAVIYKHPDIGETRKPPDCTLWKKCECYIVILWYQPRKPKFFTMIEIDDFVKEKENSKRASLTKERAYDIGKVFNVNE